MVMATNAIATDPDGTRQKLLKYQDLYNSGDFAKQNEFINANPEIKGFLNSGLVKRNNKTGEIKYADSLGGIRHTEIKGRNLNSPIRKWLEGGDSEVVKNNFVKSLSTLGVPAAQIAQFQPSQEKPSIGTEPEEKEPTQPISNFADNPPAGFGFSNPRRETDPKIGPPSLASALALNPDYNQYTGDPGDDLRPEPTVPKPIDRNWYGSVDGKSTSKEIPSISTQSTSSTKRTTGPDDGTRGGDQSNVARRTAGPDDGTRGGNQKTIDRKWYGPDDGTRDAYSKAVKKGDTWSRSELERASSQGRVYNPVEPKKNFVKDREKINPAWMHSRNRNSSANDSEWRNMKLADPEELDSKKIRFKKPEVSKDELKVQDRDKGTKSNNFNYI